MAFKTVSDTLGVSMLVEMVDQHAAEGTTEPTVFGPFHVDGAPHREMGASIVAADDPGEPLTISGFVRDLEGNPVAGATIDVWQTASNGKYDVQDPDQPPMNLRGMFTTGADGRASSFTRPSCVFNFDSNDPPDVSGSDANSRSSSRKLASAQAGRGGSKTDWRRLNPRSLKRSTTS